MRSKVFWMGFVMLAFALAAVLWRLDARSAARPGSGAETRTARTVPVQAARAERKDVPVYLEGLGTVVAHRTVTIKPQIDGRIDQVLFQEGQAVRKGQPLVQIDPRPYLVQLHQAEGALARDKASLENARLVLARDEELARQKLVAPQQIDTDAASVGQLEGTVRIDQASIESARLSLDYARITSPVDGVTGVRLVDPGNFVRASDSTSTGIVIVTQLDPVAVIFTLPQDVLPELSRQMASSRLSVEVLSRDGATRIGTGALQLIDNQINQTTATLRLKAVLPNPAHQLWPNQFVKARLLLRTQRDALVIPATALQRGPAGLFVYVIGEDSTVAMRPVQAESPRGDLAIIDHGLEAGEQVVTEGQGQLRPGARVAMRTTSGSGPGSTSETATP